MIQKNIKIKEGTITVPVHQQGGSNSSQDVPSGTMFVLDKEIDTASANVGSIVEKSNNPRPTITSVSNNKITQLNQKSNTSTQNNSDHTIDVDYLSAVERGDMETAQRMADEAPEVFSEEAKKKKDTQLSVLRWSG